MTPLICNCENVNKKLAYLTDMSANGGGGYWPTFSKRISYILIISFILIKKNCLACSEMKICAERFLGISFFVCVFPYRSWPRSRSWSTFLSLSWKVQAFWKQKIINQLKLNIKFTIQWKINCLNDYILIQRSMSKSKVNRNGKCIKYILNLVCTGRRQGLWNGR